MPATVSIMTPVVTAQPGSESTCDVTIRNTGTVVDQFAVNLVGDASAWARPVPAVVSLFPGAEQVVQIVFSPPRSSSVTAGRVDFGVRVTAQEDRDFSIVEEGAVQITGFSAVQARLVPRTSEGKRKAEHRIEVTNSGNAPVEVEVHAEDPDELLVFDAEPDHLRVEPGATAVGRIKVAAKRAHSGRGTRRLPFQVYVEPGGPPVQVEGSFEQKPKGSILTILAILVVAGVLVFLLKDQAGALAF